MNESGGQPLKPEEAIMAVLFMARTSDGRVPVREDESFLSKIKRSRTLRPLGERGLIALESSVANRLSKISLQEACGAVPLELRAPLFAHAFDLLLADGELNEAEADFTNALILALGLNRTDVERIADVIALKNQL